MLIDHFHHFVPLLPIGESYAVGITVDIVFRQEVTNDSLKEIDGMQIKLRNDPP
jgi:hypothetical protein